MSRRFASRYSLLAVGVVLLSRAGSFGADGDLDLQLYGAGVHAYFAGDFAQAQRQLTAAIDNKTDDPRVYYFRGLASERLGRTGDAMADFKKGAALEAVAQRPFDVNQSLMRVQGHVRVTLERCRSAARIEMMKQSESARKARYEQLRREEDRVVRANIQTKPDPQLADDDGPPLAALQPKPKTPAASPFSEVPPAASPAAETPAAAPPTPKKSLLGALFDAASEAGVSTLRNAGAGVVPPTGGGMPGGMMPVPGGVAPPSGSTTPPPAKANPFGQ